MTWFIGVLLRLLTAFSRLLGQDGVKALVAENIALRQQLIVLSRQRTKAPNLRTGDRIILALSSLLVRARRLPKIAVVVRPSTLLQFHRALVRKSINACFRRNRRSSQARRGPPRRFALRLSSLRSVIPNSVTNVLR